MQYRKIISFFLALNFGIPVGGLNSSSSPLRQGLIGICIVDFTKDIDIVPENFIPSIQDSRELNSSLSILKKKKLIKLRRDISQDFIKRGYEIREIPEILSPRFITKGVYEINIINSENNLGSIAVIEINNYGVYKNSEPGSDLYVFIDGRLVKKSPKGGKLKIRAIGVFKNQIKRFEEPISIESGQEGVYSSISFGLTNAMDNIRNYFVDEIRKKFKVK